MTYAFGALIPCRAHALRPIGSILPLLPRVSTPILLSHLFSACLVGVDVPFTPFCMYVYDPLVVLYYKTVVLVLPVFSNITVCGVCIFNIATLLKGLYFYHEYENQSTCHRPNTQALLLTGHFTSIRRYRHLNTHPSTCPPRRSIRYSSLSPPSKFSLSVSESMPRRGLCTVCVRR